MVSSEAGRAAEAAVASKLEKHGFKIMEKNWRRPRCEIDIVAKKKGVIYFVEVKFRSKDSQGSGLDYITMRKLDQMRFAAQMWVAENDYEGDWRLMAAEASPSQIDIIDVGII